MNPTNSEILPSLRAAKPGLLAALVLAMTIGNSGPAEAAKCRPLLGHFESQVVPCAAPEGLFCTSGTVIGGLRGTFRLTIEEFAPATFVADPANAGGVVPLVQFFVGESVISLKHAGDTLVGVDTGALNLHQGQIATLLTFDGGSGAFDGASGHIVITGIADFATGTNIGDYRGEVCTPG